MNHQKIAQSHMQRYFLHKFALNKHSFFRNYSVNIAILEIFFCAKLLGDQTAFFQIF